MEIRPFRLTDLFQTYLPALMLVVLAALFVYNIGYFYAFDRRYLSLLAVKDYYDGSLPMIILALIFYNSLVIQFLEDPGALYQQLIRQIRKAGDDYVLAGMVWWEAVRQKLLLWSYQYEILLCRLTIVKEKIQFKYQNWKGKPRRRSKDTKYKNEIKGWEARYEKAVFAYELSRKKNKPDVRKLFSAMGKVCGWAVAGILGVTVAYFILLLPFYGSVWAENPHILGIGLLGFSLFILLDMLFKLFRIGEVWLLGVAGIIGCFYFGMLGFHGDAAQKNVMVVDVAGEEYQMIRSVRRGNFVSRDGEIGFLPRAQIAKIEQHPDL